MSEFFYACFNVGTLLCREKQKRYRKVASVFVPCVVLTFCTISTAPAGTILSGSLLWFMSNENLMKIYENEGSKREVIWGKCLFTIGDRDDAKQS